MPKSVLVIFFIALWQRQESRLYEWFCTNNSVPTEHSEVWILHMQKDWQLQITYFWYCLCLTVLKTFEAEGEGKRKCLQKKVGKISCRLACYERRLFYLLLACVFLLLLFSAQNHCQFTTNNRSPSVQTERSLCSLSPGRRWIPNLPQSFKSNLRKTYLGTGGSLSSQKAQK